MDVVREDESVTRSLAELRAIELQRQADERAAIEAAVQAERARREAAEQAARDAEAARIAAERAAQLAAEQARAEAEREARLQIEAIETAERARQLIALEERRLAEELALRREVALRQRPRWMVALTALALATTAGLGWFAIDRHRDAMASRDARDVAIAQRAQAMATLREAQQALDRLGRDLVDLQARIDDATRRLETERGEAGQRAIAEHLRQLRRHEAELEDQRRRRQQELDHLQRMTPVTISDECRNNAVCK